MTKGKLAVSVARLKLHDEIVRVGCLCCFLDSVLACAGVTLGDVLADRSLKQYRFLPHVSHLTRVDNGKRANARGEAPRERRMEKTRYQLSLQQHSLRTSYAFLYNSLRLGLQQEALGTSLLAQSRSHRKKTKQTY